VNGEKQRNPLGSSWRWRRGMMFAVLAFCAWVVAYVLVARVETRPAEAAAEWAFITIISIVGAYVFGATWEDLSSMKSKIGGAFAAKQPKEGDQ
jgi:EamA domain-containing membrane protein RarD